MVNGKILGTCIGLLLITLTYTQEQEVLGVFFIGKDNGQLETGIDIGGIQLHANNKDTNCWDQLENYGTNTMCKKLKEIMNKVDTFLDANDGIALYLSPQQDFVYKEQKTNKQDIPQEIHQEMESFLKEHYQEAYQLFIENTQTKPSYKRTTPLPLPEFIVRYLQKQMFKKMKSQ